jgi:hypothetical protein
MFELDNATWFSVFIYDHAPSPRAEHNAIIFDNKLIIFGGLDDTKYVGSDLFTIFLDSPEKRRKRFLK